MAEGTPCVLPAPFHSPFLLSPSTDGTERKERATTDTPLGEKLEMKQKCSDIDKSQ